MTPNELGTSMTISLGSKELTDASADSLDQFLNASFDSGLLDDIPIVGMLVKFTRTGEKIAEALYLRTVVRLLKGVKEKTATAEQKQKFLRMLEQQGELATFGERVLLILQGIDDTIKPNIIGKLIASAIREECALDDAFRAINSVKAAFSGDFQAFQNACSHIEVVDGQSHVSGKFLTQTQAMAISSYGWTGQLTLLDLGSFDATPSVERYGFHVTPIGWILLNLGLN